MKMHQTLLFAMLTIWPVTPQLAAQQSGPAAFNHLEKTGALIGMVVTDSRNQPIGKVSDLAIDWQAGCVVEFLIDTGSKQRIVAVPPGAFQPPDSDEELRLNANIDAFNNAPAFDASAWMECTGSSSVAGVYERFHAQPPLHSGSLARASKLIGLTVRNHRNQKLAKVESVVVDLPGGRVPEIILASTGFLGIKGELTAVPPDAFYYEPAYNALVLDASKEALRKAPHFKPADWRNAVDNSINFSVSNDAFKVLRAFNTDDVTVSPTNNIDARADAAITLEVGHKILTADGLSFAALHVQITTRQGRVTLTGTVLSEREKERVGSIAASVVPADHVDNQIEVRVFADASPW